MEFFKITIDFFVANSSPVFLMSSYSFNFDLVKGRKFCKQEKDKTVKTVQFTLSHV